MLFAASAAYSAVAAKMPEDIFIAIVTIVVEISFARVVAKKHIANFFDLLFS